VLPVCGSCISQAPVTTDLKSYQYVSETKTSVNRRRWYSLCTYGLKQIQIQRGTPGPIGSVLNVE